MNEKKHKMTEKYILVILVKNLMMIFSINVTSLSFQSWDLSNFYFNIFIFCHGFLKKLY